MPMMAQLVRFGRSPGLRSSRAFSLCHSDLDGLHGSPAKLLVWLTSAVRSTWNGSNVRHELADGMRRQLDVVQVACCSRTLFALALQGRAMGSLPIARHSFLGAQHL